MDEITILQAEILKTVANPRRLHILHALAPGPMGVGRLARAVAASQPQAAAVLTAGAAALGKPVSLFPQYWALDVFRADRIERDHGLAPEAGPNGRAAVDDLRHAGWGPGCWVSSAGSTTSRARASCARPPPP